MYLFNCRMGSPELPAFLRIEECSFRHHVEPGDEFFVLCREVKIGKHRFISDVQGVVRSKIALGAGRWDVPGGVAGWGLTGAHG